MHWAHRYDTADQLVAAVKSTTGAPATVLQWFAYGYDAGANRTTEQIDDAVTVTTDDVLNRLQEQLPGGALAVGGTVNEPATVTSNGRPAVAEPSNVFHGALPVGAGTSVATIVARDASGNQTTQQYEIAQAGTPEDVYLRRGWEHDVGWRAYVRVGCAEPAHKCGCGRSPK